MTDELNQLTRSSGSDGTVYKYFYYDGGNLHYKILPDGTRAYYTYDSTWKDLLVSYGGQSITYDAIGNPLTYRDSMRFTWSGRQMNSAVANSTTTYYTYDIDGIRTKKVVGGVTTDYFVNGSTILAEKTGNNVIWYIYDSAGEILGFTYNDTPYYYVKNLQGDVVSVIDANGTTVASYTYDPWGKVVSATGTMASINPIRYRGYYYDNETGLYYLNSRYYDPEIGRFVNADDAAYLGANGTIPSFNLFAYCENNPIITADDEGEFLHILIGAAVGAVVGAVSSIVTQAISGEEINWAEVGISAASGAASGAVAATGVGLVASVAINAGISMADNAVKQVVNNKGFNDFDVKDMFIDGGIGAIAGLAGGRGATYKQTGHMNYLNEHLVKRIVNNSGETKKLS